MGATTFNRSRRISSEADKERAARVVEKAVPVDPAAGVDTSRKMLGDVGVNPPSVDDSAVKKAQTKAAKQRDEDVEIRPEAERVIEQNIKNSDEDADGGPDSQKQGDPERETQVKTSKKK